MEKIPERMTGWAERRWNIRNDNVDLLRIIKERADRKIQPSPSSQTARTDHQALRHTGHKPTPPCDPPLEDSFRVPSSKRTVLKSQSRCGQRNPRRHLG